MNGVFQVEKLKQVCYMIRDDSERLKNLPEYDVLFMQAMKARRFCIVFAVALHGLLAIYLTLPTVLVVNDFATKNKSEIRYIMYKGSYIFSEMQDHYIISTIHCYLASILIITFICPLDTMYITFTQHACAVFAVVGRRLKTIDVVDERALRLEFGQAKGEKLLLDEHQRLYEKLVLCVKEHKRALECTEIVQSAFSASLFFQIMLNILCLSITGVQALYKMSSGNLNEMIRLVTWVMGQHIHLFFVYLPGQRLLDFSTQVYFDALECPWHKGFTKSRVIYHILVHRSLSPVKLTALKLTPLNMEAFLSVTQTAVSYFTVMSSTM